MGIKETEVSQEYKLIASEHGIRLFRNQSGALKNPEGRIVRFGLGNESADFNKVCKSGDDIGWVTVTVTPEMVGKKIAIFLSVEAKKREWKETERDDAQRSWANMVEREGGIAFFCNDPSKFISLVHERLVRLFKLS